MTDQIISVCHLLERDKLPSLDLRFYSLSTKTLKSLSELLPDASTLVTIDLWSSNLGSSGLNLLHGCYPPALESLDLGQNSIGDEGCQSLLTSFSQPSAPPLRALLLAQNAIGDSGAIALAHLIQSLPSLRRLDLRDNEISNTGASSLAASIESSSLIYLSLFHNPIGDAGGRAMLTSLKKNKSLRTLDLRLTLIQDTSILTQIFQITLENQRKSLAKSPFMTRTDLTSTTPTKSFFKPSNVQEHFVEFESPLPESRPTKPTLGLGLGPRDGFTAEEEEGDVVEVYSPVSKLSNSQVFGKSNHLIDKIDGLYDTKIPLSPTFRSRDHFGPPRDHFELLIEEFAGMFPLTTKDCGPISSESATNILNFAIHLSGEVSRLKNELNSREELTKEDQQAHSEIFQMFQEDVSSYYSANQLDVVVRDNLILRRELNQSKEELMSRQQELDDFQSILVNKELELTDLSLQLKESQSSIDQLYQELSEELTLAEVYKGGLVERSDAMSYAIEGLYKSRVENEVEKERLEILKGELEILSEEISADQLDVRRHWEEITVKEGQLVEAQETLDDEKFEFEEFKTSFEHQCFEKEQKLALFSQQLDALQEDLDEKEQKLALFSQQLDARQEDLDEKEQKLALFSQQLDARQEDLDEKEQKLALFSQQLDARQEDLDEKEQKLALFSQQLDARQEDLDEKEQKLALFSQQLDARQEDLDEKEQKLALFSQQLDARQEDLDEKEQKLALFSQQLDARQEDLAEKEQKLALFSQQLDARQEDLDEKEQKLALFSQQLDARQEDLDEKEQKLALFSQQLDARQEDLAEKEQKLVCLENKEQTLVSEREFLEHRSEEIKSLEESVRLEQGFIKNQLSELEQKKHQFHDLEEFSTELNSKESNLKDLESELLEKSFELIQKEQEIKQRSLLLEEEFSKLKEQQIESDNINEELSREQSVLNQRSQELNKKETYLNNCGLLVDQKKEELIDFESEIIARESVVRSQEDRLIELEEELANQQLALQSNQTDIQQSIHQSPSVLFYEGKGVSLENFANHLLISSASLAFEDFHLEQLRVDVFEKQSNLIDLESRLETETEDLDVKCDRLVVFEGELQQRDEHLTKCQQELEGLKSNLINLEDELNKNKIELEESRKELDNRSNELSKKEESVRQSLLDLETYKERVKNELCQEKSKADDVLYERQALESERKEFEQMKTAETAKIKYELLEIEQKHSNINSLKAQLKEKFEQLSQKDNQLKQYGERLKDQFHLIKEKSIKLHLKEKELNQFSNSLGNFDGSELSRLLFDLLETMHSFNDFEHSIDESIIAPDNVSLNFSNVVAFVTAVCSFLSQVSLEISHDRCALSKKREQLELAESKTRGVISSVLELSNQIKRVDQYNQSQHGSSSEFNTSQEIGNDLSLSRKLEREAFLAEFESIRNLTRTYRGEV
ncbi:hypothetical protein P9112_011560 [Eukaryota sp. TZLM1-RC]